MSSVSPNLNLVIPDDPDHISTEDMADNFSKIDTAVGQVISQEAVLREVPFAIAVGDWTGSSPNFTANFTTAYITASSKEIVQFDSSLRSYAKADINVAKKSGGGGITLTTSTKPSGTVTGTILVFATDDGKVPVIIEDTVIPITNGGTGQSNLAGAKQVFGITALSDQIASLEKNSSTASAEVNLNSYDSTSNEYVFPYDGYIVLDGGSASNGYIRCVVRSQNGECKPYMYMNVTASYQIQSLFVKKGMKVYVSANTVTGGNVKYYPLNNKQ